MIVAKRGESLTPPELADKGVRTVKMTKSFRPPFSKGGAVEAAEASSPSAEGEIPLVAFLFVNGQSLAIVGGAKRSLFYCAYFSQRKSG